MTRRPDVFDRSALEHSLRDHGCPEPYLDAFVGDFKLFVPLLFRELGTDAVLSAVNGARVELGLKERDTYWRTLLATLLDGQLTRSMRTKHRRGAAEQVPSAGIDLDRTVSTAGEAFAASR